ncbi:universal stress protein [Fundicoccus culcitae]|uniref:Universal stress protein n=1 Tax=Fundicoccus culcitae TaxID=2969821 RepID=A0ABY5P7Y0_9LACT|nr:universal stress protein [Fundicoccus culcitae]UUX34485.1 universal stress protein [Fundicoccus culcitae]
MTNIYKNILIPVDGSQQSIDAFKNGVHLAKKLESNVYLVRVLKDNKDEEELAENRETFFAALERYANGIGVSLTKEIVFGEPRTQIAEILVDKWDIDLIVMGATGKGRIAKMTLGSITEYVVRNAKCAVLIGRE